MLGNAVLTLESNDMQIKIFETSSPHPNKQAAINEVIKSFICYWKENSLTKDDLIAFCPNTDDVRPFGFTASIWVLIEREKKENG